MDYCDKSPIEGLQNVVAPSTGFSRTLNSVLPLTCANGYNPGNNPFETTCDVSDAFHGTWTKPNAQCDSMLIHGYLLHLLLIYITEFCASAASRFLNLFNWAIWKLYR